MREIVGVIAGLAVVGYLAVAILCALVVDRMVSKHGRHGRLGWTGFLWAVALCAFWPVVFVLAIGRKRKGEQ